MNRFRAPTLDPAPTMVRKSRLHTFLGAIGLLAWLLFILGCTGWPSWSPDGAKILAPFYDPVAQQHGIALYDLKTRTARSIFVQPSKSDGSSEDIHPAYAQWESDGKRAIIAWPKGREAVQVILLPLGSGKPARQFFLGDREDETVVLPLPELGGMLYVGGSQISRLDLKTGESVSTDYKAEVDPKTYAVVKERESEAYLATDGSRILYEREVKGEKVVEVGTLDPGDLSLHPLFKVALADLEARGLPSAEIYPVPVPDPHGSRIAIIASTQAGDSILLCSQAGVGSILQPDFGLSGVRMGPPQWAPGGKMLYLAAAAVVKKGVAQYWVAEVPLAGGRVRLTPIARFKAEDSDWDNNFRLTLQVSLSPDGSTLATTTAGLGEKQVLPETKRALYLVNLRDPRRTVTSIPAPLSPGPRKAKEQK